MLFLVHCNGYCQLSWNRESSTLALLILVDGRTDVTNLIGLLVSILVKMKLYVVVFRFVPLLMDFQGAIAWFLGNHTRLNAKGDYCLKFVPLPSIGEELKSQPLFDSSAENALLFLLMPMNVEKLYISKKVIFKAFCWREKVQMLNS